MAHDHTNHANNAIAAMVRKYHPSKIVGWMLKSPASALNLGDQAWMGFLGEIIKQYRIEIAPCTCPDAAAFAAFRTERLGALRDALKEATQCA